MPSLLESLTGVLDEGDAFDKLGGLIGGDKDQAESATGLALPLILGGLANRVAEDDGPEVVIDMLDADDGSALGDLGGFFDRGDEQAGRGILDGIFGIDRDDLVGGLASKAEMGGSMINKLLPMLAPVVIGAVSQRRGAEKLDAAGVASLLAGEKDGLVTGGLLDPVIDLTKSAAEPTSGPGLDAVPVLNTDPVLDTDPALGADLVLGTDAALDTDPVLDTEPALDGELADRVGSDPVAVAPVSSAADVKATGSVAEVSPVAASGVEPGRRTTDPLRSTAGTGMIGRSVGPDGETPGGLSWLWWALGAVVLVLLLAWLLSMCNDQTGEVDAGVEVVDIANDDSAAADIANENSAAADEGSADDGSTDDGSADAALQAEVDAVLVGTGVTGVVVNGSVALDGTVDSEQAAAEAGAAVESLDGVTSMRNRVAVTAPDGQDQDSSRDYSEGELVAGRTINELLDLDPVTFTVRSARITAEGQVVLDEAAAFLDSNPGVRVEIGGHTDNDGTEAKNLALSQARADSVKQYLQTVGIDGDRMETTGYGEAEPLVPNDSSLAKAENRRIEFTIL